jgi:hypothetical protein
MPLGKVLAACVGAAQRPSDIRIELVKTSGTAPAAPARPLLVSTDDPKHLAEWLQALDKRREALRKQMARLVEIESETCRLLGKIAGRPRGGRGGPQDWCCDGEPATDPAADATDAVTVDQLKMAHRERKKAAAAVDCALVAVKAAWAETMGCLEARGDDLRVLLQRCDCECHGGHEAPSQEQKQAERDDKELARSVQKIVDEYLAAKVGRQTAEAPAPATDQPATQTPPASAKSKPTPLA